MPNTPVEAWPPGYDRERVPGATVPRGSRTADGDIPRTTLITTGRPVVLLGGGAGNVRRDARILPDAERVTSRATVRIGPDGETIVTYSDMPTLPADISRDLGCGPAAGQSMERLAGYSEAPLAYGDEGPTVGAAQQLLCVIGYAVPQDGEFGVDMETAVFSFQTDVNAEAIEGLAEEEMPDPNALLEETGMLDVRTRRMIDARAREVLSL